MTTTAFNVRATSLRLINSMTKYPSIPTYHALDPTNGALTDETTAFTGRVIGTEKIDGTNSRIILLPDGTYLLGSREELLYAEGDLIGNPALGIVDALRGVADNMPRAEIDMIRVFYLEVYGGKVTAGSKQYTGTRQVGWLLFDVALIGNYDEILTWNTEQISSWRDRGGQQFVSEVQIQRAAELAGVQVTPRLFTIDAAELPTDIEKTKAFLDGWLPVTRARLDGDAGGRAEGIVLRTPDRSTIAKARFQDYERTMKRRTR